MTNIIYLRDFSHMLLLLFIHWRVSSEKGRIFLITSFNCNSI